MELGAPATFQEPSVAQQPDGLRRRPNARESHEINIPSNLSEITEIQAQLNNPETAEQTTQNIESGAASPVQALVANKEHAKRLTTYTKTALTVTFGLFAAFYTNLHKLQKETKILIMASFISLLLALFLELLLLVLIDCIKRPNPDCLRCKYEEKMYIFIYASTSLLMLTAMLLLLLCTPKYAYLAAFLTIALLVNICLLYQGKPNHTASIKKYEPHDSELNHFSELSSAMVIMLFTGLSSFVFPSPTLSLQKNQTKVTECFLFIIIVKSLLLMLLTTVPPAAQFLNTRKRMIKVIRSLFNVLVTLLTLVGLMAASEVLKGIVVFSTFAHIIGAMYWFVTELLNEHEDLSNDDAGPLSEEFDSLAMVCATATFFALMFVYFQNVDNIEPYRWRSYLLLATCMISLCSTFMSFLTRMVIFSYALNTRAWKKAERILNFITYILLIVAFVSTILHAFYGSPTSKGSST